jgi:hypothetical protein
MIELLLPYRYSWVKATNGICTLVDYSMAKKCQQPAGQPNLTLAHSSSPTFLALHLSESVEWLLWRHPSGWLRAWDSAMTSSSASRRGWPYRRRTCGVFIHARSYIVVYHSSTNGLAQRKCGGMEPRYVGEAASRSWGAPTRVKPTRSETWGANGGELQLQATGEVNNESRLRSSGWATTTTSTRDVCIR